jgi:hypothetical protein
LSSPLIDIQIDGRDPVAERVAEQCAETFPQLADEYMRRWAKQVDADGKPRKRTWREDQRKIDRYLLPERRHRRVKDITRRDARDLIDGIAERRLRKGTTEDGRKRIGAPIMSNRVLALAKKVFNFALDREWIEADPAGASNPWRRDMPAIGCSRTMKSEPCGTRSMPNITGSRASSARCC